MGLKIHGQMTVCCDWFQQQTQTCMLNVNQKLGCHNKPDVSESRADCQPFIYLVH